MMRGPVHEPSLVPIVFTKDRAMQLDAFIRSWARHVLHAPPLVVLHDASSERHATATRAAVSAFAPGLVSALPQAGLKATVLRAIAGSTMAVFFTDDSVFTRTWDAREARAGLSLRHGLHLSWCYPTDSPQALPPCTEHDDGLVSWRWMDGEGDWGYPLSIDGHIFSTHELSSWLEACDFASPTALERELQQFTGAFSSRTGVCYRHAKIVNVPTNVVQREHNNRHAGGPDAARLLAWWESGLQLSLEATDGILNASCHEPQPLLLEPRP